MKVLWHCPVKKVTCDTPSYTLNYKGIPYRTEWVEYPDIEPLCLKLGAAPTDTRSDGRPYYSLPVIYDPSTKKAVSDSAVIAKYLDETYPDTPQLFPEGTAALQAVFLDGAWDLFGLPLYMIMLPRVCTGLNPPSEEYYRRTREAQFGSKLEEIGITNEWETLEAGLAKLDQWLSANGPGKSELFLGDKISFADVQVAAILIWGKITLGEESEDWRKIVSWNSGRWKRLLERFDQYANVDI